MEQCKLRYKTGTCRTNGIATAVNCGAESHQTADCISSVEFQKRTVAVKGKTAVFGTVCSIYCTVKGIEGRFFNFFCIFGVCRKAKNMCKILHPCYGNAGFLHSATHTCKGLCHARIVKQFVGTTAAAGQGNIRLDNRIRKVNCSGFPFFNFGNSVIFQQTFEAGHHFICLYNRILERQKLIFISHGENVPISASTCIDNVFPKIKIFLFARYIIQTKSRFQNRCRVNRTPVPGSLGNGGFAFFFGTNAFNNIV